MKNSCDNCGEGYNTKDDCCVKDDTDEESDDNTDGDVSTGSISNSEGGTSTKDEPECICGNGIIDYEETCDDGSGLLDRCQVTGCNSDCSSAEGGYCCVGGNSTAPSVCSQTCGVNG